MNSTAPPVSPEAILETSVNEQYSTQESEQYRPSPARYTPTH